MQLLYYKHAHYAKIFRLFFLCGTITTFLVLNSCQDEKPEGLIPETKLVTVMADLHLVDGYVSTLMYNDSSKVNKQSLYRSVYAKHNISPAVYDMSLKYYSRDPKLLDSMYVQVEKRLNSLQKLNTPRPINDISE